MGILSNLKPERVFYYFEEICGIPHGSGNTEKISDYCVDFAKNHDLEYVREEIGNVIIKKPASIGKESSPTLIIQGHLDMVCEKEQDLCFDFEKDPIQLMVEDDWISARGTTLGGDDGIAVAMALAILEDDTIVHPALEVLLTVDEETGLFGADALDGANLKGRALINIDSEEEGFFTVSCAGGIRADLSVPVVKEENNLSCYKITVGGLRGGHSGVEIHKGRLNSNKVAAALLKIIEDCYLISVNGGQKENAIPLCTEVIVATDSDISILIPEFIKQNSIDTDPDLFVNVEKCDFYSERFDKKSSDNVVRFLNDVPNGIIKWSEKIDSLVETSLNLGILKTSDAAVDAVFGVRSSVKADKEALLNQLKACVKKYNGNIATFGAYPAWEYNENSLLREKMVSVYTDMFGIKPKIVAIHAGLECGMLSEKLPGLDAVSIGPDMCDVHTSREKLSVLSTERIYNFILKLLEEI